MVHLSDGSTDFFDIVAGVFQAPYLFIIRPDYVFQTSIDLIKEIGFTLKKKKARSKRYPKETITDAGNTVDLVFLANTPDQAESMLYSLEQAAWGIGFHVNVNKAVFMCFEKKKGTNSTLSSKPKKLGDQLTYISSNISFTESDVNIRLAKAWTAMNRLSIIWKSDLSDKIKLDFFQAVAVSILPYGCTLCTLTKHMEKKAWWEILKNAIYCLEQSWKQHPMKQHLYGHFSPFSLTIQVRRIRLSEYCWRRKDRLMSDVLLWTTKHGRASIGQRARTYISSVRTLDVVWRTCRER